MVQYLYLERLIIHPELISMFEAYATLQTQNFEHFVRK